VKVHYGEGLAHHTGPESYGAHREVGGEALTGERAGQRLVAAWGQCGSLLPQNKLAVCKRS
jgi:hypothetical protein